MERHIPSGNYLPRGDTHEQDTEPHVTVLRDPNEFIRVVSCKFPQLEHGGVVPDEVTISTLLGQLFQISPTGGQRTASCNSNRPIYLLPQSTKQLWEAPTRYCIVSSADRLYGAVLLPVMIGQLNSDKGNVSTSPSAICFADINCSSNRPHFRSVFPGGMLRSCIVGRHNLLQPPKYPDTQPIDPRYSYNDLIISEDVVRLVSEGGKKMLETAQKYSAEDWDEFIAKHASKIYN